MSTYLATDDIVIAVSLLIIEIALFGLLPKYSSWMREYIPGVSLFGGLIVALTGMMLTKSLLVGFSYIILPGALASYWMDARDRPPYTSR